MKEGLIYGMSDEEYHAQRPIEEHYWSSSQLKKILEDPEIFYNTYITKKLDGMKKSTAMDIGTWYHTEILEPDLVKEKCISFKGTRKGKVWDNFAAKHEGKIILPIKDKLKVDNLVEGTLNCEIAMDLIDDELCEYEVSLFHTYNNIRMKVRFDIIRLGKDFSYIADLKSTSGNVRKEYKIKDSIESFGYALSAAMYIELINSYITKNNLDVALVGKFYWIFATKGNPMCMVWDSSLYLPIGSAQFEKAIELYTDNVAKDWEFEDHIGVVKPSGYLKQEWINNDDDLL